METFVLVDGAWYDRSACAKSISQMVKLKTGPEPIAVDLEKSAFVSKGGTLDLAAAHPSDAPRA